MPEISAEHNVIEYSVSEVAGAIKRVVEDAFGHIRLRGELSGYRGPHSSGHCYFKVKDETAVIDAVMWKGNFGRLNFKPEDGLEVILRGKVTTYPGKSNYQIVVESMEPAGVGALMALLEKRKAQLMAEGLFDPARKQELPFLPEVIGVVTSPTGAVIRDILHRLSDRFPRHVIVWPVAVQGEGAAAQIAAAINGFQSFDPLPDLLIVARGGGSIEDLWAFNEEVVVRAAAASMIPLISAVGHETDTTLIDYASDKRAPTPTAAAEMAVPVREEWRLAMVDFGQRMARGMARSLHQKTENLNARARMLPRLLGKADQATQRLDDWSGRLLESLPKLLKTKAHLLGRFRLSGDSLLTQVKRQEQQIQREGDRLKLAMERRLRDSGRKLAESSRMLAALDYQSVLERGFVLVRDADDAQVVMRSGDVKDGQSLVLQFKDGKRTVRA